MIVVQADRRRRSAARAGGGGRSFRGRLARWVLAFCVLAAMVGGAFAAGAVMYRTGRLKEFKVWYSPRALPNYLRSFAATNDLPTVRLDVKFKHLLTLRAKRDAAVARGILFSSDADYVPAAIRFEGRTLSTKIRLKGDWTDHLETDRWSFRVHVKGGEHLFGMRRFSLQAPATRNYLNEWCLLEHLRIEGVIAPRYRFVNLIVNGDAKGLYAVEESFSKELLESQERLDGVIVKLDEGDFWLLADEVHQHPNGMNLNVVEPIDFGNARLDSFRNRRIDRDPAMRDQRAAAFRLLRGFQTRALKASEVFDVELLAKFMAVYDLWSVEHGIRWHNLRFYYDAITNRLEPIGFDAQAGMPKRGLQSLAEGSEPPLWTVVAMEDPLLAAAYAAALQRMCETAYGEDLRRRLSDEHDHYLGLLHREAPALAAPWPGLAEKQAYVRNVLSPPSTLVAYASLTSPTNVASIRCELGSVLTLPVEVVSIRGGDGQAVEPGRALAHDDTVGLQMEDGARVVLPRRRRNAALRLTRFDIPLEALRAEGGQDPIERIIIESRILGLDAVYTTEVAVSSAIAQTGPDIPEQPTVQGALARHPFLERSEGEHVLAVKPGTWAVEGDLVLPRGMGLRARGGVVLRFGRDAMLYANGPLDLSGDKGEPVVLKSRDDEWMGIAVIDANGPSFLENVEIHSTAGVHRPGWLLTGATLFYRSPVTIRKCRFLKTRAEDALNIKRTRFEISETEFTQCASDALDADFCTGVIRDSSFSDILGDAIDISGSNISITGVRLRDVADKGVSVGENSVFTAIDTKVTRVGIAVASKDLSATRLQDFEIVGASVGLACFTKKPEYGPASIVARNVTFVDTAQPMLVHTGSTIELDGETVLGSQLDVKRLYEAGILGN